MFCFFLTALISVSAWAPGDGKAAEQVTYTNTPTPLRGFLCKPSGGGPFPLVVINHGGVGDTIGSAPRETFQALAVAGFVGFSPIRRQTRPMRGHIDDIFAAIQYGLNLPIVDRSRVALMGFSRGALLTLAGATQRADLRAVVVMATAFGGRGQTDSAFGDLAAITAPVLLLVAQNDTGSRRTNGKYTLDGSRRLNKALIAAGRDVRYIEYPPFVDDGHALFFEVGDYWSDVVAFLRQHL